MIPVWVQHILAVLTVLKVGLPHEHSTTWTRWNTLMVVVAVAMALAYLGGAL
jgi:hypothetical protein